MPLIPPGSLSLELLAGLQTLNPEPAFLQNAEFITVVIQPEATRHIQ